MPPLVLFSSVNGEICTQRRGSAERFEHMKKKTRWFEDWPYPSHTDQISRGNLRHILGNSISVPRSETMNRKPDFWKDISQIYPPLLTIFHFQLPSFWCRNILQNRFASQPGLLPVRNGGHWHCWILSIDKTIYHQLENAENPANIGTKYMSNGELDFGPTAQPWGQTISTLKSSGRRCHHDTSITILITAINKTMSII